MPVQLMRWIDRLLGGFLVIVLAGIFRVLRRPGIPQAQGYGLNPPPGAPPRSTRLIWADSASADAPHRMRTTNHPPRYRIMFRDRLNRLKPYARTGQLLDVGCSSGLFLEVAAHDGWDVHGG